MTDAIWLPTTIFAQYFSMLGAPLSAGWFSIVANCGLIALIAAITLGVPRRQYSLLWFLIPLAMSQVFLAVAGFFRGDGKGQVGLLDTLIALSPSVSCCFRSDWSAISLCGKGKGAALRL